MTYPQLETCWGGGCDNEPTDECGLCDACLDGLLDDIEHMDVSFP